MVTNETPLHEDLLDGAGEISEFLYGDRKKKRRVYYMADKGLIPITRKGRRLLSTKSAIRKSVEPDAE